MTDDDGMTWGYRPPTAKGFDVPTPDDAAKPHEVRTANPSPPTARPAHEPTREPTPAGAADPNPVRTPTPPPPVAPMPMTRPRRTRTGPTSGTRVDIRRSFLTSKALWFLPVAVISLMVVATRPQNEPEPTFPTFDLVDLTFGSLPRPEFPVSTAASASSVPTTATNNTHLALGEYRDVESFAITVVDFVPDATTVVADANFLNEPAPAGHRYVIVSVEAENQTLVEATWWVEMLVEVRDGTGATYPSFQGPVAPDPLSFDPVQPGAVDLGNLVFTVPDDVVDLEFVVRPDFGLDEIVWQLTS